MTDTDPIDDMAAVTLARYAIATKAIVDTAIAMGLPETEVRATAERARAQFLAELASGVMTVRAMCDDPTAPRN